MADVNAMRAALMAELLKRNGGGMGDPTGGNALGAAMGPQPRIQELMGNPEFIRSFAPTDRQHDALEKKRAMARQLMGSNNAQKYTTPTASLLGGLSDLGNMYVAKRDSKELDAKQQELGARDATAAGNQMRLQRAMQVEEQRRAEAQAVAAARAKAQAEADRRAFEMNKLREQEGFRDTRAQKSRALSATIASKAAEAAKAKATAEQGKEQRRIERALRDKLLSNVQTKGVQTSSEFYRQITGAPNNGVGDLSRIYGLAKMFDPGGRVTDSDAEQAAKTGGLPGALQGYYYQIKAEGQLSDTTRREMNAEAKRIMRGRVRAYLPLKKSFEDWALNDGARPGQVIPDLGEAEFTDDGQASGSSRLQKEGEAWARGLKGGGVTVGGKKVFMKDGVLMVED